MKKAVIYTFLVLGTPFILGGVIWTFAKDAFRFGCGVGESLLDYLNSL